jgi:hypothetical protein
MWLVEKKTGQKILIFKYYPKTRWGLFPYEQTLNDFLRKVTDQLTQEFKVDKTFGPTSFELQFEHVEVEP